MTAGYAGKILRINLTNRAVSALNTQQHEDFGGGNGMGSALFWELCQDKAVSGFNPKNVVTIMSGPLSGTLTPGSGRTEICGINVFSYPVEWFSRSSIGGFFSAMLRYAGWDGVVIEGKADKPVWINILNDRVTIEDAGGIWGLGVLDTQKEIWRRVTGRDSFGEWLLLGSTQTTQGPSILCIGPGGESLSRLGTIQSGNGMGAGQGGFGGVWGAKSLKAISVIGTGSIKIADPVALLAARERLKSTIEERLTQPESRRTSCAGCFQTCKARVKSGMLNDAQCLDNMYRTEDTVDGKSGSDIIQNYGLNLNDTTTVPFTDGVYLHKLYEAGILGPGKAIDSSPLPMDKFGSGVFTDAMCKAIINKEGIGADLTEGLMRAAEKWGRLEQDLASGMLHKAHWGYGWHWSLPFVEQAYGSLMGDREITEHFLSSQRVSTHLEAIGPDKWPALVEMLTKKLIPYDDDPLMLDFNWQEEDGSNMKQALSTGIYSEHKAKLVAWHRHYTRFWIESILYCDLMFPIWFDKNTPDFGGFTSEAEPRLHNAVTGKNLTFADGIEIGRKIWNLNRAIWVLQGRHRDMENFAGFMFTPSGSDAQSVPAFGGRERHQLLPVYKNGKWEVEALENMYLDKAGVEQWKTHFYKFEGWDPNTGWPIRSTLEELGLKNVADTLEDAGKLGSPG